MFLTGILVLIWINLFKKCYTYLFIIIFAIVFILEMYGVCLRYRFRRINIQTFKSILQSRNKKTSHIPWQSSVRRSMLLKIQKVFHQSSSSSSSPPPSHNHYNSSFLFDYRCPICLNTTDPSFQWLALGCGHVLCSLCVQHVYFGSKPICPHCRSSIILSDLTILYVWERRRKKR